MTCKEMIWGGRSNSWESHGVSWWRWTRSGASNTTSKSKAFILILLFIHLLFFFLSAKRLLNAPWHSSAVQNIYFPSELLVLISTDVITRLCFIRGRQRKCALSRFICRCVFPVEHNSRLVVISAPVTMWLPAQNIIRKCRLAAEDRLRHSDATLKLLQGKRDWPRAIYSLLIKVSDNSPPPVIC